MSSVFTNNVVTQAGLRLIAEATAANPIVYVDALSASQIPQDPEAIPFYNGVDGVIDASSATDNTARIVSRFGNSSSSTAQPVKAIAITARLSSQSDSEKVIFAYCSDANSQIVFPPSSAPEQRTRFAFNLTFDGQGTVEVVETGCAALSDLERLVSCHKAGQPTVGERQSIYGVKNFQNDVYVGDETGVSIRLHGEEYGHYGTGDIFVENAERGTKATLTFNVDGVNRIEVDADNGFCPAASGEYNLGDPSLKWNTLYVDSIGSQTNFLSGIHTAALNVQSEEMADLLHIYGEGSSGEAHIRGAEDVYLEADQSIYIISQDDMTINSNSIVEVFCHGFHVNSLISATAFEGLLPYAEESNSQYHPEIPVGSIVWVWFGSAFSATLGQAVTAASFTPATHLAVIKSDGAWGEGLDVLPNNSTFVPLVQKATGTACAVPCMRKA